MKKQWLLWELLHLFSRAPRMILFSALKFFIVSFSPRAWCRATDKEHREGHRLGQLDSREHCKEPAVGWSLSSNAHQSGWAWDQGSVKEGQLRKGGGQWLRRGQKGRASLLFEQQLSSPGKGFPTPEFDLTWQPRPAGRSWTHWECPLSKERPSQPCLLCLFPPRALKQAYHIWNRLPMPYVRSSSPPAFTECPLCTGPCEGAGSRRWIKHGFSLEGVTLHWEDRSESSS